MPDQPLGPSGQRLAGIYGGLLDSKESAVAVPFPGSVEIPRDPDRIALVISNVGANAIMVSINQFPPLNTGLLLPVNSAPFILTVELHGSLAQSSWFVQALVGASAVYFAVSRRER